MKGFVCVSVLVAIVLLFVPEVMSTRHIGQPRSHAGTHGLVHSRQREAEDHDMVGKPNNFNWGKMKRKRSSDTVRVAGSSLPDCSHACGSCSPCRLVMVSFVCASIAEAETCPMAYKCMCKNRSYPVP
ncbi:protein EPIDERMAL PATTERNING FACTOR 1-like [Juglans microcarpa x Juglans regia]|uniref:protein EPIDERMAL PATTERNING FACTOR 1-like n=1 Tax=Juglans microcarpa x Juglans regia TaxID=2249226 RepID=UPI001B7F17E6|nr:protein EPIDERMAL PATTERNING FACTOR 1-like [Juglans microcarpa x Juglans regia]